MFHTCRMNTLRNVISEFFKINICIPEYFLHQVWAVDVRTRVEEMAPQPQRPADFDLAWFYVAPKHPSDKHVLAS